MIKYTITIPTYNRLTLLKRSIEAIEKIHYNLNKFELIVVDDGSTDETIKFLKILEKKTSLNFKYFVQQNSGKYAAVCFAAKKALGSYFIVTDSDDYLDTEILNKIDNALNSFKHVNENLIAGIVGLNYNLSSQSVEGNEFKNEFFISDPIEMRFKRDNVGDEIKIVKTKYFKEFNFPDAIESLKFIPESYVYYGLSSKYKFIYSNEIMQYIEYQEDGLTTNIFNYRLKNSYGCYLTYKRYIELISIKKTVKGYIRNYLNYIRFALHSKSKINFLSIYSILFFPIGFLMYLNDLKK